MDNATKIMRSSACFFSVYSGVEKHGLAEGTAGQQKSSETLRTVTLCEAEIGNLHWELISTIYS